MEFINAVKIPNSPGHLYADAGKLFESPHAGGTMIPPQPPEWTGPVEIREDRAAVGRDITIENPVRSLYRWNNEGILEFRVTVTHAPKQVGETNTLPEDRADV